MWQNIVLSIGGMRFITDRGVTHELVRHRLCAYTQESTRYCNYAKKGMQFIKPVFWNLTTDKIGDTGTNPYAQWVIHMVQSELTYNFMINKLGASPQEARTVLPNSLKTEIVCTANIREWRHILRFTNILSSASSNKSSYVASTR